MSALCKNILVTRLSALGDVVMTIPVIYPICRDYPECRFTLLTSPMAEKLFIDKPGNLCIITIDTKNKYKGIKGIFKVFNEIKGRKFDAVADLHNVLRSKILRMLFILSGTKVARMHKGRREKKRLTDKDKKGFKQLKSSFARYSDVFERLGFKYSGNFTPLAENNALSLPKLLVKEKGDDMLWIGIAPVSKHRGKNYPLERMEKVVNILSETGRYRIFLFGSPDDNNIFDKWCTENKNVVSLVTMRLGFANEISFMKKLDLLVSMDSANMHLAALMGTRVLSIWGETHPYAGFLGWGLTEDSVLQRDLPCRPCSVFGNKPCRFGTYACLDISTEKVIEKIEEIIKNKR
ncbi:MAG: glycosyltransferase family 9 protein [Bacteroidales bacterium]